MVYFSITFCKVSPFERPLYCTTRPQLISVLRFALVSIIILSNAHCGFGNWLGQYNMWPRRTIPIDPICSFYVALMLTSLTNVYSEYGRIKARYTSIF